MDLLLNNLNSAGLCSLCFGVGRRLVTLPAEMKKLLEFLPSYQNIVAVCWRCRHAITRYKKFCESARLRHQQLTSLLQAGYQPVQFVIQDSLSQTSVIHFDTKSQCLPPISIEDRKTITIKRHTNKETYEIETTSKHTDTKTYGKNAFVSIQYDSDDECLADLRKNKTVKKEMKIDNFERKTRKVDCDIQADVNNDDDVPVRSQAGRGRCGCERCGRVFACASALRVHTDSVHLKLRPYRCDRCDKRYATPGALWTHRRCGHGSTPLPKDHVCERCGKAFKTRGALTAHARTHAALRPYQCDACAATFKHNSALYMHRRLVHRQPPAGVAATRLLRKGLPLSCVRCPASFRHASGLYLHARLRHGAHTASAGATADDAHGTSGTSDTVGQVTRWNQ